MPRRLNATVNAANASTGSVRIIGGRLRGSKLPVLSAEGLRPSSDRSRETLFNWLQPVLAGAKVLDAFAGSGALGIEAASRGAASVLLLERSPPVLANLQAQVQRLGIAQTVSVQSADTLAWLRGSPEPIFDLVFLDPPFADGAWDALCQAVDAHLSPSAWVYLETPRSAVVVTPPHWRPHRETQTRDVRHALYRRDIAATLPPPLAGNPPTD